MPISSIELVLILGTEIGSVQIMCDDIADCLDQDLDMHLETNADGGTTTCVRTYAIPLKFRFSKIESSGI